LELELYTFEDADGNSFGTFTTTDPSDARRYASEHGLRMVANTFIWSDSELAADYTGRAFEE
jgi:hypothetical protein